MGNGGPHDVSDRNTSVAGTALDDIRSWGCNTHSFLSLYKGISHFRLPGVQGYVPYVETDKLILVSGEPVAPQESYSSLLRAMRDMSGQKGKTLGILPAREISQELLDQLDFDSVFIGKEPIFDLRNLPKSSKSIRQAVNRAEKLGITIVNYEDKFQHQVQSLCSQWQDTRELPALQFLFQLRPMDLKEEKKFFLAVDDNDKLHAFLSCSPIPGRNGWYLEDLIRDRSAPNGTTELLLTRAMRQLQEEGYEMATLALAPLAGLPENDEKHPWLNKLLRLAYKKLSFIYHFQTLEYFKGKFKPSHWEPNYFYFYPRGVSPSLVRNLLEAFLGDNLFVILKHKVRRLFSAEKIDAA